ncbi:MAG: helix-turn-helix domain-containing protein [Bacillota bacterium]
MNTPAELPAVLTVRQLQRILQVGKGTAYELLHRADFPKIKVGRVWRVPVDGLARWLAEQQSPATK